VVVEREAVPVDDENADAMGTLGDGDGAVVDDDGALGDPA
jgi:hypothetical protein